MGTVEVCTTLFEVAELESEVCLTICSAVPALEGIWLFLDEDGGLPVCEATAHVIGVVLEPFEAPDATVSNAFIFVSVGAPELERSLSEVGVSSLPINDDVFILWSVQNVVGGLNYHPGVF